MISPHNLIQEQQLGKPYAPWRILVVCALLNRTHGRQVRPMIDKLFELCPSPTAMVERAKSEEVMTLLRPLGFVNRRTDSLKRMSQDYNVLTNCSWKWQSSNWTYDVHGCGQYARDSINIFIYGQTAAVTTDTWLNKYLEWKRAQNEVANCA